MIIRDAVDSDNLKMLEIHKDASQSGAFEIVLLKKDFKSKSKLFEEGFYLVAEDENSKEIIGFMGVGIATFKINGKVFKGAYFYDLRTNPKHRNKLARWLKKIIDEASSRLIKRGDVDFYYVSVKSDNAPSMRLMKHFSLTPVCKFEAISNVIFNKPISKKVEISDDFDLNELEKIYTIENDKYDFLPLNLKENFFLPLLNEKKLIKFQYNSATIYGWNTQDISDIGIIKISKRLVVLQKTLKFFSKIIPLFKIPELNKNMKNFHVFYYDYKNEKDFKKLLKSLHGYCYKNDFYLLNFFLGKNSKINKKIFGKINFSVEFTLLANAVTDVDFSNLKEITWLPRL